jgi:hypothetical protein
MLGDPAAVFNIPQANKCLTNTRSDETFAFIQKCIDMCLKTHYCSRPLSELIGTTPEPITTTQPGLPARLIDVSAFPVVGRGKISSIRLVDVEAEVHPLARDPYRRYLTLSHCWGRSLSIQDMTLVANFRERTQQIRIGSLNKNFQDAIEITRRLGERYLWIDALCIVQDSDTDKATEIAKMGDIYKNSFLTIVAGLGGDSSGGCFNTRSSTDFPEETQWLVEIANTISSGAESTVIFCLQPKSPSFLLKNSPLSTRGWTYQERILSSRLLHFTHSQLVWECRCAYWLEDMLPVKTVDSTGLSVHTVAGAILQDIQPNDSERDHVTRLVDHWYRNIISEGYTSRIFSKREDRLVAVAGLAKIWTHYVQDAYLAGHWENTLAFGLAWRRHRHSDPGGGGPHGPSWSWASHSGLVTWDHWCDTFQPDRSFKLEKSALEYIGPTTDEFSPIASGAITITGRMAEITVTREPSRLALCSARVGEVGMTFGYDYTPDKKLFNERTLQALALGVSAGAQTETYVLVLEEGYRLKRPPGYKRAGLAHVSLATEEQQSKFWAEFREQTVDIF